MRHRPLVQPTKFRNRHGPLLWRIKVVAVRDCATCRAGWLRLSIGDNAGGNECVIELDIVGVKMVYGKQYHYRQDRSRSRSRWISASQPLAAAAHCKILRIQEPVPKMPLAHRLAAPSAHGRPCEMQQGRALETVLDGYALPRSWMSRLSVERRLDGLPAFRSYRCHRLSHLL